MNSERSFYNQPIRSLQTMLRTIAMFNSAYPRLIPDGIYGPETQQAVRIFQRNQGLPVTGVANQQTWDEVVRLYDSAVTELSPAQPIEAGDPDAFPFPRGAQAARVRLAQFMLQEIADQYACVCPPEVNGSLDELMVNSLMEFQRMSGLPITGKLDKSTWQNLVLQFTLAERKNRAGNPSEK